MNVSKSLGVMIDETLTWHCHVDLITKKVNSGLYVLKRLRDLVDVETLLAVYKTLIHRILITALKYGVVLGLLFETNFRDYKIEQYV